MNAFELGFALLTFAGIVAVIPAWMWFLGEYGPALTTESRFIAGLTLPALIGMFLASWVDPR